MSRRTSGFGTAFSSVDGGRDITGRRAVEESFDRIRHLADVFR